MPRGRPSKSIVRDRLVEMLFVAGKLTAYDAHKHYLKLFGAVSQRNIYYQLQRGEAQGIFKKELVEETGHYTWGTTAQKIYYSLTPLAQPHINKDIRTYFLEVSTP
jgi:hypothetical protein